MIDFSPYAILGVPQWVIDEALTSHDESQLVKVSEAQFRSLSRLYHPDMGGDSERFVEIVDAYSEIRHDPLEVAKYYTSNSNLEARRRRNMLVHSRDLGDRERKSLASLLVNVNPRKVAPWLSGKEAIIGNQVFDNIIAPTLITLMAFDDRAIVQMASMDYDGRKFIWSKKYQRWRVSVSGFGNQLQKVITSKRDRCNIIGGISPSDINHLLIESVNTDSNQIMISSTTAVAQLRWVPLALCSWLGSVKPTASQSDFLAICSIDRNEPMVSIIGPVFKTRSLT